METHVCISVYISECVINYCIVDLKLTRALFIVIYEWLLSQEQWSRNSQPLTVEL